jgi:protocatechuate 3,4-dioxygenase alpha subunit
MPPRADSPLPSTGEGHGEGRERTPTPSQTVGPFFGIGLPFPGDAEAAPPSRHAVRIEGQLLDGNGEPVSDGLIEVWSGPQFARCRTDPEGAYHVSVTKPVQQAEGEAPHLNVTVFARGLLRHLATRMYFPDEGAANAKDRVLDRVDSDRRGTLIAHSDGGVLRFDIKLQGESETVFFAL